MASNIVYFDLETTGLNHPTQKGVGIVSIGAILGKKEFHRFMFPRYPITPRATEIHGIVKDGDKLLLNGSPICNFSTAEDGIKAFFKYIRKNSGDDNAQWYKIRKKVQNYQMLIAKDPKTNNFHHKILGFLSLFAKQSSFWISQNPSSKFLIQNSILDFWSSSQEFILVYFMQMNQNTPIIY